MRARRGREALLELCRGPGRLGQALAIGPDLDGETIGAGRIELVPAPAPGPVMQTPRIGITRARRAALALRARGLALRQPVPSLTISVIERALRGQPQGYRVLRVDAPGGLAVGARRLRAP